MHPQRRSHRRKRTLVRRLLAAAALLLVAIATAFCIQTSASSRRALDSLPDRMVPHPPASSASSGRAGGAVPTGTTVLDEVPGVTQLDPELRSALRDAARAAARDGVTLGVTSGWRSAPYQRRLLDEAIHTYGSREEAARWVALPERSAHVSGDAVDIEPAAATDWLAQRGAAFGLCQIYANESWHVELRTDAIDDGHCPSTYPDPTHDPRLAP